MWSSPYGRNLCGFFVQSNAGSGATDRCGRPLAGTQIHADNLIENDASSIRIEGCLIGMCGGEKPHAD